MPLMNASISLKKSPKVLVVEDDTAEAQLVRFQLCENAVDAFEVELATSLAEVKQLLEAGYQPDVVLLDLNLPDSTGIATVDKCLELLDNVPLVVHTGRDDFSIIEAAIEAGAEDYLLKGVESWILRKSLRYAILRHERDEHERMAKTVFHHASEAILITDEKGVILDVNEAFTHITGYSREEALGQTPAILASGHHNQEFYKDLWESLKEKERWKGEVWNRRKSGEIYTELLTINAVTNTKGEVRQYVAMFSDITLQKEEQKSLQHRANHDALTGLPNRSLFLDRLEQSFASVKRHGGRLAVVFLDLDGFKPVNDTYGHDAGDYVLQEVAARVQSCLREEDTLARVGGDEFVLLLQRQLDMSTTLKLLQRVLAEVARPCPWREHLLQVSASLGVTLYPNDEAKTPEKLLQQADQAMYQAKNSGKNDFCFHDRAISEQANLITAGEMAFRRGLNNNEFELYYQPVIDLRSGQPIALEALLRWQHPQRGLLLPEDYLETVEQGDLILDLGEWAINQVLEQLNAWHTQGQSLPVSLNIAGYQLQQVDFPDRLYTLCKDRLPEPGCLRLEIKELTALEKLSSIEALQACCQRLGIQLVLDDFGAGYTSMPYLKRLHVSEMKIKQDFIAGMQLDTNDLAVVEATLGLASAFRCQLTAKGVETQAQCRLLTRLGCDAAQGYYFSPPLLPEQVAVSLNKWPLNCGCAQEFALYRREDLPLLSAGIEHHAWMSQLEKWLIDAYPKPPELDSKSCRFGHWWHQQYNKMHDHPLFIQIGQVHEKVHQQASKVIENKKLGDLHRAQQEMQKLHHRRAELMHLLDQLLLANHPERHFGSGSSQNRNLEEEA
ncbi:response regulator receiver modulated diguanylate cyclase/phosphodiesterase with PAS/PAC sensor(s) [Marinospirillum celere]|uniref:Response regulator receiver modulated diguanylate cyclase/phosphodiesterase with PAS/PAC sensor(S) n=1 Tax=Marinospirillum celere TaxID=1122252 RepID=A0A1I1J6W3_9GAMM|nr:EAL domain-containing protein [Marinospirillum celere]SFC44284.1 response regulator receiver modulated diguanylate cyclase/phosphodiesterase with PAS/PAC sensor(s) [Marinospirillum celere]